MKKLLFILLLLVLVNCKSQTPIQAFNFNGNLSNTANNLNLSNLSSGTFGYVVDRFGVANSAISIPQSVSFGATIPNLPIGSAARSISIWVKFGGANTANTHYIWSYGVATASRAFGLSQNQGNVNNYGWANDHIFSVGYNLAQWYHYVITFDGITTKIYRDGVMLSQANKSWQTSTSLFRLCANPNATVAFEGEIDDLKIYDVALTQSQVDNLFSTPLVPGITNVSSLINSTSTCIINYSIQAYNNSTNSVIKYGTTISNLNNTTVAKVTTGNTVSNLKDTLTALQTNTKYYYRIEATNSVGTTQSNIDSFTIPTLSNSDLLAYYNFEDDFLSFNGIHNFTSGASTLPTFSNGKYGKGANFLNQTLINSSLSNLFANNATQFDYTICFWEKRSSLFVYESSYELFGSQYLRTMNTSNQGHFAGLANKTSTGWIERAASVTSSSLLNNWHHYAVQVKTVGTDKFLRVYINGVLATDLSLGANAFVFKFNNIFALGGGTDANGAVMSSKFYKGMLDELYVYKRALNETEILQIMNNSSGVTINYSVPASKPQVNLLTETNILNSQITLNYAVKTNYAKTSSVIKYSTVKNNLSNIVQGSPFSIDTSTNPFQQTSVVLSGLIRNTKYYYQIKVINSAGSDSSLIDSFTTSNFTSTNLIREFKFDGTRSDVTNTISFSGTSGYTTDRFGNANRALSVNNSTTATAENVTIPGLPTGRNNRSFSMWFRRTNNSTAMAYPFIQGTNAAYSILGCGISTNSAEMTIYEPSGLDPKFTVNTNNTNWYHYVLTLDSTGTMALYLNGNLLGTRTYSQINTNTTYFKIAHFGFTGAVDDLKLFSGVLDSNEVKNLYNYNSIEAPPSNFNVGGRFITPNNKTIKRISLVTSGAINSNQLVDSSYSLTVNDASTLKIKAIKNNDIVKANGVTSTDLLLIQRHALNTVKLNNAYKIIAADVDGNRLVNSTDILRLKRFILQTDTTFRNIATNENRLWTFIDSSFTFADTTNPFPFKDSIVHTNINSNKNNQTFIGVKLGDVTFDWNSNTAKQKPIVFEMSANIDNAKNIISLPFVMHQTTNISSMQSAIHFNNIDYEFVSIKRNKLNIEFNDAEANEKGVIHILWLSETGDPTEFYKNDILFEIELRPRSSFNSNVNIKLEEALAIKNFDLETNIVLKTKQSDNKDYKNELVKIYPTNINTNVLVDFKAVESKTIKLNLNDIMGKKIAMKQLDIIQGENIINYELPIIPKGLYIINLLNADGTLIKSFKVIKQ